MKSINEECLIRTDNDGVDCGQIVGSLIHNGVYIKSLFINANNKFNFTFNYTENLLIKIVR